MILKCTKCGQRLLKAEESPAKIVDVKEKVHQCRAKCTKCDGYSGWSPKIEGKIVTVPAMKHAYCDIEDWEENKEEGLVRMTLTIHKEK